MSYASPVIPVAVVPDARIHVSRIVVRISGTIGVSRVIGVLRIVAVSEPYVHPGETETEAHPEVRISQRRRGQEEAAEEKNARYS